MENFKRSTARDFRINCQAVDAILNDNTIEEEEEEEGSGESGGEGGVMENGDGGQAPKAKKLKRR